MIPPIIPSPFSDIEYALQLAKQYRSMLLDNVLPFWMRHALDKTHGGYHFSVDRQGNIIDTDKSVWAQGRFAWLLSTLYSHVEKRSEWLEAARSGVEFLINHCFDPEGKMYFLVAQDGKPLRMRRYCASESFAAIAFAAYGKASGDARYTEKAASLMARFMDYTTNRHPLPPKWTSTRPMQSLSGPMIAISTAQVLRQEINYAGANEAIDWGIEKIRKYFYRPDKKAVFETVGPHGELYDTFDGRLLNPGHAIEASWFILHEALIRKDSSLTTLAIDMLDCTWERGWDQKMGGLFYYRDVDHKPIQEYWSEMKFWWPHNEAEIATLLAWKATRESRFLDRLKQVHDYQFSAFPDLEFGEWFGYLHRDGSRSTDLKGNHWKSCFHIPRMLLYNWKLTTQDL